MFGHYMLLSGNVVFSLMGVLASVRARAFVYVCVCACARVQEKERETEGMTVTKGLILSKRGLYSGSSIELLKA